MLIRRTHTHQKLSRTRVFVRQSEHEARRTIRSGSARKTRNDVSNRVVYARCERDGTQLLLGRVAVCRARHDPMRSTVELMPEAQLQEYKDVAREHSRETCDAHDHDCHWWFDQKPERAIVEALGVHDLVDRVVRVHCEQDEPERPKRAAECDDAESTLHEHCRSRSRLA